MTFKVVIPARLGSTRLPRKVLLPVHGKPLLQYVWQCARASGAEEIVIATDDAQVLAACQTFGADTVMTSALHQSGTDRVNEVAQLRGWSDETRVVNLQGDEPLMPAGLILKVTELLARDETADIATLCHPLHTVEEWLNPNFVKVVMDVRGHALYFSRALIPWKRDGAAPGASAGDLLRVTPAAAPGASAGGSLAMTPAAAHGKPVLPPNLAYRHIGLYAYRVSALKRFSTLPASDLETLEALEQLRALVNGLSIRVGITRDPPPRGVDTPEDLAAVTAALGTK